MGLSDVLESVAYRHTALQVQRSAGPTQAASFEWLERVAAQGRDENVAENTFTT